MVSPSSTETTRNSPSRPASASSTSISDELSTLVKQDVWNQLAEWYLKQTTDTKNEDRALSHALEKYGSEFRTFILKDDRPVKIVVRGLPASAPIEDIKAEFVNECFSVRKISRLFKGSHAFILCSTK
ncbi:hypothetical protein AVEN_108294-1 [Araneus ventricosus]|uniref:Uncharacterized protein n=1 Tax=Araneus ventricosus TaxID=182803 RepID=A0A4Y2P8T5_ARAVE|nr:hypothetical protein AVEN_108294-1 [Araneus ventricosus]